MPIEASRRQRPSADVLSDAVVFATHRRLARRHQWQQRLLLASGGALLGSLIGLLLGSPLWQALSLMGGFAAGLLIPRPGSETWALGWIEAQVGFSYRTALELSHDAYGLAPAVKARARQALRRLTHPTLQPWWLPLLVLAVGLLLPFLGLGGWRGSGPVSTPPGVNAPLVTTPPPEDAAVTPITDEPPEEPVATSLEGSAPAPAAAPDLSRDADLSGPGRDAATGTARHTPLDSEALSQFLERLAQEPPSPAPAPVLPHESVQPGAGTEAAEPLPGEAATGDRSQGIAANERPDGAEIIGEGEVSPQEDQPGNEAQGPLEPGEQTGAAGEPSDEARSQELGDTPNDGAGDTAGAGETVPVPVEPALGEPQQPLELLPGQLQEGPAARVGVILQPGQEPGELPAGLPAGGFERAVEQALTEGRIPVKFQEILRNYFR